jgi:hypothetical protein
VRNPRRIILPTLFAAVIVAACGASDASPRPTASPAALQPTPAATPAAPTPPPASPSDPATPGASITSMPTASPAATPSPRPTPTAPARPSPGADLPNPDGFWGLVARGVRRDGTLVVEIAGPAAGTLRFEVDASATVIENVVGFVCVGGRAYDGQSGFTTIPGRWTCGVDALIAGFRSIGQPIDAWNATIPADRARRESVTVRGDTWTWTYRATSSYYGGAIAATVTLDRSSLRITSARRTDPTGETRYAFRYGADFPAIAVPR